MKIVFDTFETPLELRQDKVNVLRIADKTLFSRCVASLADCENAEMLENFVIVDSEGKDRKTRDALYFAGDPVHLDCGDKKLLALAVKKVTAMLMDSPDIVERAVLLNEAIQQIVCDELVQLSGSYAIPDRWSADKFLKSLGFCVDVSDDATLFDKTCHFVQIAGDLFPDKVLVFVHANTYMSESEYQDFCKLVIAQGIIVLSCEFGDNYNFSYLENGKYVDNYYLEY